MKHWYILLVAVLSGWIATAQELRLNAGYAVKSAIEAATPAEETAKAELTGYLERIFGRGDQPSNWIILKYDPSLGREEFTVKSAPNGDITIAGGRPSGVLYGVYWFLDRKCGVHWFTPETEYVPKMKEKVLRPIDYHGKPAFALRVIQIADVYGRETEKEKLFGTRNLVHDFQSNARNRDTALDYQPPYAPPYSCHALHMIITPEKYFKTHPEFWALQDGKRDHRDPKGMTADYCLTNDALVDAVVGEVRGVLRTSPGAYAISLQEGDHTRGFCECPACRAMQEKFGGKWSGLWVYFTNRVAQRLAGEFPGVLFKMFAYDKTKEAPENIKAADNVAVELCTWGVQRGLPHDHPANPSGAAFMENLKKWRQVSSNIFIWDYVYTFNDRFLQAPNLLHNIENLRNFRNSGVKAVFTEGAFARAIPQTGAPMRTWLIARAMWDPDECGDGRALLRTFCVEYYGTKAGTFIHKYLLLLHNENNRQKFYRFTGSGAIGNAAFNSEKNSLKAYDLFQQALQAASFNNTYTGRVKDAYMPLQYHLIANNIMPPGETREKMTGELLAHAESILPSLSRREKIYLRNFMAEIRKLRELSRIDAAARQSIGSHIPALAYDGNLKTYWHSGANAGWIQRTFDEPLEISRITSVLSTGKNSFVEYRIEGSLDGKTYFDLVPKRKISREKGAKYVFADDELSEKSKAKYIRTTVYFVQLEDGRRNDATMHEQIFNAAKLPDGLF